LSLELRYMLYARLFMAAGKSVLLVGAPGTGKTRLACTLAVPADSAPSSPVIVTGRDGLSFEKMTVYYQAVDGGFRLRLGPLARAVIGSWLLLFQGYNPLHLVVDEINRCRVDLLLGEVFTALDIPHRMSVSVVAGEGLDYVLSLLRGLADGDEEAAGELGVTGLGLGMAEAREAARRLAEAVRGTGRLPLPYSFRIIATMNLYDRANLYRVGWALQRRFATLYVLPPYASHRVKLDTGRLRVEGIGSAVKSLLGDAGSSIYQQALNELLADERIARSLTPNDKPTLPVLAEEHEVAGAAKAVAGLGELHEMIAAVYSAADGLGVELGVAPLVDAVKTAIIWRIAVGVNVVGLPELVDVVLSALILPLLGVAAPRVRRELLLGSRRMLERLRRLYSLIVDVLGPESLSAKMVEAYDVPYLSGY